jgi:hypothetical protein
VQDSYDASSKDPGKRVIATANIDNQLPSPVVVQKALLLLFPVPTPHD